MEHESILKNIDPIIENNVEQYEKKKLAKQHFYKKTKTIPPTNGVLDFFIVNSIQSHILKQE